MNLHALYLIACCLPWMYTHTHSHENSSTVWVNRVSADVARRAGDVYTAGRPPPKPPSIPQRKPNHPFLVSTRLSSSFLACFEWYPLFFKLFALWTQTCCPDVVVRARYTVTPFPCDATLPFIVACCVADDTNSLVSPPNPPRLRAM